MTTINRIRTISEDTLKHLVNKTNPDRKEIETLIKYGDLFLCLPLDHTIVFKNTPIHGSNLVHAGFLN